MVRSPEILAPIILLIFTILVQGAYSTNNDTIAISSAPDFRAADVQGHNFSLSELRGKPAVIHITNVENPVCRECEKSLKSQIEELSRLKADHPEVAVVTLNLRKNPYSKDGRTLAGKWWQSNISWPWIEDLEPYPISSKYMDYWDIGGGFSNPTILLVDKEGRIARVYHVYKVGEGEMDGVRKAESLYADLQGFNQSRGTGIVGQAIRQDISLVGMFFLGIITSLAPCSVALMIAMFSYVMISRRREMGAKPGADSSREGFMMGVAFTLGMGMVFFVIGLFISQMGLFIRDSRFFDLVAGLIMILLGISNFKSLGEMAEPITCRIRRNAEAGTRGPGLGQRSVDKCVGLIRYSAFISAFALGIIFALGWAPCAVSMVFPVLIWLSAQNVTPLVGGIMLFTFGLGHGVPIIPISTFSRTLGGRIGDNYVSAGKWITKFFGLAVIIVGLVYAVRYFGYVLW